MASSSVAIDMEALIDLFLSPAFHPFESDNLPKSVDLSKKATPKPVIMYEAEVVEDDDNVDIVNNEIKDAITRQCGRVLANLGDDFYRSHASTISPTSDRPWRGIGEALKSVFIKLTTIKETDPNYEEEKEKAWKQFTEIMSKAVTDNPAVDVYRQLGAVLLTLRGVTNLAVGASGIIHVFYNRYIRERQLDRQIQKLGGLKRLVEQELD